ncbi:hypothetical protein B0H12DRAFT_1078416 [Mycena haematopus]|nr:hypothetical protein B0H12DRAFT_1078416 [Mycena haematopus]
MTVLISGRDEPRVVFDVGSLFEDPAPTTVLLMESAPIRTWMPPSTPPPHTAPTHPHPFGLSPPDTGAFFAARVACRPRRGEGVLSDVPHELFPVLYPHRVPSFHHDQARGRVYHHRWRGGGGGSCFADILMPGEFYYRNSWWAGKFEYPNDVKWEEKKGVLCCPRFVSFRKRAARGAVVRVQPQNQ